MMMPYSFYQQYLNTEPSSLNDYYQDSLQEFIDDQFENSSSYYVIQKKDEDTGLFSDIGVRVTTPYTIGSVESKMNDDVFNLIFKNKDVSNLLGDIYEWEGYRYMTVDIAKSKSPTNSCKVQRCNIQLYFTESTPLTTNIITIDGIATNKILDSTSNQYVVLPQGEMLVKIPYDTNSVKIKDNVGGGTRFLIGDPIKAWQCIGMDTVSHVRYYVDDTTDTNGFVELRLKQVATDNVRDNLTNKVAWQNYFR